MLHSKNVNVQVVVRLKLEQFQITLLCHNVDQNIVNYCKLPMTQANVQWKIIDQYNAVELDFIVGLK